MTAGTHPLAEPQKREITNLIAAFQGRRKALKEKARKERFAQYADYGLNDIGQWVEGAK